MTLGIFLLIVMNDIVDTAAQLIMKGGLAQTGISSVGANNALEFILKNASSPLVWLGITVYAANFVIWILILYKVDLSIALPIGSTSYIFVPIAAVLFLHEQVNLARWVGTLSIVLGLYFLSLPCSK